MANDSQAEKKRLSEANVVLELRMADPMSEEVLDANSDDVLRAVEAGAADIALGPAVALNTATCAIKLRFDVIAEADPQIHERIAQVISVIIHDTDLQLHVSRSSVESQRATVGSSAGEFAAA